MRKSSILHQLKHHNHKLRLKDVSKISETDLKAEYQKILNGESKLSARERRSIKFYFEQEVKKDDMG